MSTPLSRTLFREVRPAFFRLLSGPAAPVYIDALDALEIVASHRPQGIPRDDAVSVIEEVVVEHAHVVLDDSLPQGLPTREKARALLDLLLEARWLEEEQRPDWQRLIHFDPNGIVQLQTLRKLAFPQGVIFSDKLVSVCSTLASHDAADSAFRSEPWQHIESCVAALQEGIAELRGMQKAIERHTRQQLAAGTVRENLAVLFDQFAERIGKACYAELVRARLPLRLAEARRRVEELQFDSEMLPKMQAEVLRREPALPPEVAITKVRSRLEELAELLESVVPVADAVDRRTAEFTRRSLARFRYLQETTSENRARVQELFEALNHHCAGLRVSDLDPETIQFPAIRLQECRILAGVESLFTPRLRRAPGQIEPLEDEISEEEQGDAVRRLHSAMRDSLTVARANRFATQLLSPECTTVSSSEIPVHCEEDLADVIACLLHAHAADAQFRIHPVRQEGEPPQYDVKLSYRIERFTLSRR